MRIVVRDGERYLATKTILGVFPDIVESGGVVIWQVSPSGRMKRMREFKQNEIKRVAITTSNKVKNRRLWILETKNGEKYKGVYYVPASV